MPIDVHFFCGYRSDFDPPKPTDAEFCGKKFKDAIKGLPINGYADLPHGRLQQSNADDVFDWFGKWGEQKLGALFGPTAHVVLTPIPNSSTVGGGPRARTRRLADAIAQRRPTNLHVRDLLNWTQAIPSAHAAGGTRNAAALLPFLRVDAMPAFQGPWLLVDDVLTTGGHMSACITAMANAGHVLTHGLVAVRALHGPIQDVWNIPPEAV